VYFAITVGDKFMGLEEYFQLEGLAYRLVPYKAHPHDNQTGEVNTEIMYENIMEKFKWGNMNDPDVYLDETNLRMTYNFRNNFVRLASALAREGKSQKAIAVLDKAEELMPDSKVSYNYFNLLMADLYIDLKEFDKAEKMLNRLKDITDQDLNYYSQFTGSSSKSVEEERRRADLISNSCMELLRKIQFKKSSGGKSVEGATAIMEADSGAAVSAK
jgi:tetratricopeptide (TPR) repeat protein